MEKDAVTTARSILLSEIVNNSLLSFRERVELFFDVYWNCFMRENTAKYIDERVPELDRLVTDPENCKLGAKKLWDFQHLKYKDRDLLVECFRSWHSKIEFNMEELRDRRLRHHYKERYDYRNNLIDFDYTWNFKNVAPNVRSREYLDWRNKGVAFEIRSATYIKANRTMASYVDGEKSSLGASSQRRLRRAA